MKKGAQNIPKVPNLRFPGFVGEWEVKQLGDDSNILMCKRIFAEQTNESEGIPFYKIGTLGKEPDAFISKSLFDEYINKYNFPKIGEILQKLFEEVDENLELNKRDYLLKRVKELQ